MRWSTRTLRDRDTPRAQVSSGDGVGDHDRRSPADRQLRRPTMMRVTTGDCSGAPGGRRADRRRDGAGGRRGQRAAAAGPPLPRHPGGRRLRRLRRRPGGRHHAGGRRLRHRLGLPGRARPATYTVSMRAAGAAPDTPPVLSTTVEVAGDSARTVAGVGLFANLGLEIIDDSLATPPQRAGPDAGARGASNAQTVDVATADGTAVATALALRHHQRLRRRPRGRDHPAGVGRRRAAHRPAGRRRAGRGLQPGGARLRRRAG